MKILFLKKKIIATAFILSTLLNLGSWGILYFGLPHTDQLFVLRYNIYFGISRIGPWWHFLLIPLVGLLLLVLNFLIVNIYVNRQRFVAYFLSGSTLFLEILVLIVSIFYWRLNV